MAKKKLITLAKEMDFTTSQDYLNYITLSHINGNFSQCKRLFNEMKKADKIEFIEFIRLEYPEMYDYFINLL